MRAPGGAQGGHAGLILDIQARARDGQTHGAIHGTRIQVQNVQAGGNLVRDGGFARAYGPVDGNVQHAKITFCF